MNLTQPSQAVGAIPSSASRLCDRTEAAGLLERQTSPGNRREVTLRLSADGHRWLESFTDIRWRDFEQVLGQMDPHAQDALLSGVRDVAAKVIQPRNRRA